MDYNQELFEIRQKQIADWRTENQLGFSLWMTTVSYENEDKDCMLEAIQCKDGVYILQTNIKDSTFLIYKCQADICQKTVKR